MSSGEYWQHPTTFTDEYPWHRKSRPGFKPASGPAPGEGYGEMVERYGRPIGPFENGRELPYGVKK